MSATERPEKDFQKILDDMNSFLQDGNENTNQYGSERLEDESKSKNDSSTKHLNSLQLRFDKPDNVMSIQEKFAPASPAYFEKSHSVLENLLLHRQVAIS
mmetsp:Transcript_4793/g.5576  ORF Transcript_4793/g.5576 Transcript_4793/m.5576 type:complete len:100 (-) Transcript_4793:102-401(-)